MKRKQLEETRHNQKRKQKQMSKSKTQRNLIDNLTKLYCVGVELFETIRTHANFKQNNEYYFGAEKSYRRANMIKRF